MMRSEKNILSYFDGTPWPGQADTLTRVAEKWDSADVFVVDAPVGSGKSLIADCITRWAMGTRRVESGVDVANSRLLVDQYLGALKGWKSLMRKDSYQCEAHGMSCALKKEETDFFCLDPRSRNVYHPDSCPYVRDLRQARGRNRLVVNQHVYLAHRLFRELVIFDEAHTLESTIADSASVTLWRSEFKWPRSIHSADDASRWLSSLPASEDERLAALDDSLSGRSTTWTVACGSEPLRGRETEFIRLSPLDVSKKAGMWWPSSKVQKLVLMSATLDDSDVDALGLRGRRVVTIHSPSPIPAANRPIVWRPIAPMDFRRRDTSIWDVANHISGVILPHHAQERGVLHIPYGLQERFRMELGDCGGRLVWARQERRTETVAAWLADGRRDSVLVGSGLQEGLDLRDDLARFQVFPVTPRRNVSDPGMLWLAERAPRRFKWLTIREMAQGTGRVCRHPADRGVTYFLDSGADRELFDDLVPKWMAAAIQTDSSYRTDRS